MKIYSNYMDWHFLQDSCKKSLIMYINWIAFNKKKKYKTSYIDRQNKFIIEWTDSQEKYTVIDYRLRDLYDFFDEKDIKITISYKNGYMFKLITNSDFIIKGFWPENMENHIYNTRGEAEVAAFRQSFILLEDDIELLKKEWRDHQIKNIIK